MEGLLQNSCPNGNCTTLTLDSNRLSGHIPPSFSNSFGLNILSGNLFQCRQNNIPRNDPRNAG